MSVTQCAEINRRLRALGVTVHEAPGAASRGNGQLSDYVGGLVHHTASGYGIALPGTGIYELLFTKGRTGSNPLAPPLCNYAGNKDGSLTYGAAGPANHAGASGGRSMGPLPVTSSFNRRVLGLEIVYPGDKPMTASQYRTATLWAKVVADVVGGGNIERVRAHAETSVTGKWDPGYAPGLTINMAAFRAAAKQGAVNDMEPTDLAKDPGPGKWGWEWLNTRMNAAAVRAYIEGQLIPGMDAAKRDAAAAKTAATAALSASTGARQDIANLTAKVDKLQVQGVDLDALADKVVARLTALRFEA